MVKFCSSVANVVYLFWQFSIMKEIDHGIDLAVDGTLVLKLFFVLFPEYLHYIHTLLQFTV